MVMEEWQACPQREPGHPQRSLEGSRAPTPAGIPWPPPWHSVRMQLKRITLVAAAAGTVEECLHRFSAANSPTTHW